MDWIGERIGFALVALLVATAVYTARRYYQHQKWYHELFLAIHAYNCAKIAEGANHSVIEYAILSDYPDFFDTRKSHKTYILSTGLDRVFPYLPEGAQRRWMK